MNGKQLLKAMSKLSDDQLTYQVWIQGTVHTTDGCGSDLELDCETQATCMDVQDKIKVINIKG